MLKEDIKRFLFSKNAVIAFIMYFAISILNNNMWSVFNVIRKDLNKLTNKTRGILSFLGFILAILITVVLKIVLNINSFENGLVLGFLLAIKDTCFKYDIVENA